MATATATIITTGILSRQEQLLQQTARVVDEDQRRRTQASLQQEQANAAANATLQAATNRVDGLINEVAGMVAAVNSTVNSAWSRVLRNGQASTPVLAIADPTQQIEAYRGYAARERDRALAFLRAHSHPSGIRQATGWSVAIVGTLLSCTLGTAIVSSGNDGGGVFVLLLVMLAIAIATYNGIVSAVFSPLRTAVFTLQRIAIDVSRLRGPALNGPQAVCQSAIAANEATYRRVIAQIDSDTAQSFRGIRPLFDAFTRDVGILGAPWNDARWRGWAPMEQAAEATRIGELRALNRAELPPIAAFIPTPSKGSLIIKASGDGKKLAAAAFQSVITRQLATIPPSKVSYVFIDPVDLGQNVATFMPLAEHDELLFTSRAWTEPKHIEEQLGDLARHMENVIQKYLQNRYQTIEEYNLQAGEVAEPYRVLVVSGFPANFTDDSMRRLVSIVKNGARCGVTALVLRDTALPMPYGTDALLAELENSATIMEMVGNRFVWREGGQKVGYENSTLTLDSPGPEAITDQIIEVVGKESKRNRVVRVPFSRITPAVDVRWVPSTAAGVEAPIGRAGAKRLQAMTIGADGVRQHALVVGRTGSGKSRLLQAMITNLALTYSPDELVFYLIDFKKVGFAAFAEHHLAHAEVISTETEREFALSVLEKLDTELEARKKIFGTAQDIATFRSLNPTVRMPRILLVVDEFQEFFTQDDRIFRDAALYLDRLVRQGRGFGIHIILGSQTLRGQYTLPDATRGQMAIRIALQSDEDDSRKILSDDNPGARLLTRPGEAIYNDQNGLLSGNNDFQTAWLPDDELNSYLDVIAELARNHRYQPPVGHHQVIFDGAANADVTQNDQLLQTLLAAHWPTAPTKPLAWLGDPVAIKAATAASFRRQSGANLLLVGQQEDAALGVMSVGLLSLAAQHAPNDAAFYIVDMSPTDSPLAGYLPQIAALLPHETRIITRRGLPDAIEDLHAELTQRIASETASARRVYLFIFGLQRARDLRMDEDAGYPSYSDGPPPPDPTKQFAAIVREGPEFGIHTVLWCDTLTNLNRTFERRAMREFALRVAFQMSADDSNALVDSPQANTLGSYRAFFFDEEEGRLEKFRPYAPPDQAWLTQVESALNRKTV